MGIQSLRGSFDFYDTKVTTLEMRRDYPDDIKEDYWQRMITLVVNDLVEPNFNDLKEHTTSVHDNIEEIFDLKKLLREFRDANDEDGALIDDVQIEPYEGSLVMGVNLIMKN